MLKTTKDMYKEKHIGSDFVTFEQQQLNMLDGTYKNMQVELTYKKETIAQ